MITVFSMKCYDKQVKCVSDIPRRFEITKYALQVFLLILIISDCKTQGVTEKEWNKLGKRYWVEKKKKKKDYKKQTTIIFLQSFTIYKTRAPLVLEAYRLWGSLSIKDSV